MEPPSLSTELRKLLLWLTLACFSRKLVQKQIDWTSRTDGFSQKRWKWAWFCPKVGVASQISPVLRAQLYYWNPPSGNPGSATEEEKGPGTHCTRMRRISMVTDPGGMTINTRISYTNVEYEGSHVVRSVRVTWIAD